MDVGRGFRTPGLSPPGCRAGVEVTPLRKGGIARMRGAGAVVGGAPPPMGDSGGAKAPGAGVGGGDGGGALAVGGVRLAGGEGPSTAPVGSRGDGGTTGASRPASTVAAAARASMSASANLLAGTIPVRTKEVGMRRTVLMS